VERIVQSARDLLAENLGIPDAAREVFRSVLPDPAAFRTALVESVNSDPPEAKVPLWQLPLFFHKGVRLPELAPETVLDKYPEYINSGGQQRIALFVGCFINHVYTDIADAAIDVLKRSNVDVFLPKDQVCCGAPALLYGDKNAARELAERNLAALKPGEFDAVITLCPTGGVTLKHEYKHMLGDDAGVLSSKVHDISGFIDKFIDYEAHQMDMSATYHESIYLSLGLGVEAEPRRILSNCAQFIEMDDADESCGMEGALGLLHPELSMKMVEAKIKAIEESGADTVATGSPGCILFLREQLAERGTERDVLHTVQILQKSLET
jgi:glycolate oxidase iron-sulfur subunit